MLASHARTACSHLEVEWRGPRPHAYVSTQRLNQQKSIAYFSAQQILYLWQIYYSELCVCVCFFVYYFLSCVHNVSINKIPAFSFRWQPHVLHNLNSHISSLNPGSYLSFLFDLTCTGASEMLVVYLQNIHNPCGRSTRLIFAYPHICRNCETQAIDVKVNDSQCFMWKHTEAYR